MEQVLPECHFLWRSAFFWQSQAVVVVIDLIPGRIGHGVEAIVPHIHAPLGPEHCFPVEDHTLDLGIFRKSN
jgi:hypothetical protein